MDVGKLITCICKLLACDIKNKTKRKNMVCNFFRVYCLCLIRLRCINSLAPGKCNCKLKSTILKLITQYQVDHTCWNYSHLNATDPHWKEVNIDPGNGLVPSGSQCWPSPMVPCGIMRPQWVNHILSSDLTNAAHILYRQYSSKQGNEARIISRVLRLNDSSSYEGDSSCPKPLQGPDQTNIQSKNKATRYKIEIGLHLLIYYQLLNI